MQLKTDSVGNDYFDIGEVRLTLVQKDSRPPEKDWCGEDVFRINAYHLDKEGRRHLRPGPEFPKSDLIKVIRALTSL